MKDKIIAKQKELIAEQKKLIYELDKLPNSIGREWRERVTGIEQEVAALKHELKEIEKEGI